jgi:hypothetical protein
MSAEFAQACNFKFATLKWFTPVSGLGPELCPDRGLALPHPWDRRGLALGTTSMGLCWCDSGRGTGSPLCYRLGTGIWQVYESTPLANIPVNRHQSSISSLES